MRWTERRNLEEVLRLMASRRLRPSRLTTLTLDLDDGIRAHELAAAGRQPSLGIMLRYPGLQSAPPRESSQSAGADGSTALWRPVGPSRSRARVAVIGAGSFARGVLMPALARTADIVAVANATSGSARAAAARFGAPLASTDPEAVIDDPGVDTVVIATPHDTHARYAAQALELGKHVFVEKPLALDEEQLDGGRARGRGLSRGADGRLQPPLRAAHQPPGGRHRATRSPGCHLPSRRRARARDVPGPRTRR